MLEEKLHNYKKKECPFKLLFEMNGKGVLISETGEKSSILPIKELDCYVYTHDNATYVVFSDDGVDEECANDIRIDISKLTNIEVIDLDIQDDQVVNIHILTRFKSGNEIHIYNAA